MTDSSNKIEEPVPLSFDNYSIEAIQNLDLFKNSSRLFNKLKDDIQSNNFYEIHQLYKTIHFRAMNNNMLKDCLELIYNGILYFASKNNIHCCFDLSKVFIETLKKCHKQTVDDELLEKIKHIHAALKNGQEERGEFAASILKWSTEYFSTINVATASSKEQIDLIACQKKFGHLDIHRQFAFNYWSEKNYILSRYHFLHSQDGDSFAKMMIICHLNHGFPSEYDLFLAQCVLQYLHLRNPTSASQFMHSYLKLHPHSSKYTNQIYSTLPLVNFVNFLLQTIKLGNFKTYQTLLSIYKPSLAKDPSLNDYLEKIGQFYFNIKSKSSNEQGNMFSNLLRALTSNESSNARSNPIRRMMGPGLGHGSLITDKPSSMMVAGGEDYSDEDEDEDDENVYENNFMD